MSGEYAELPKKADDEYDARLEYLVDTRGISYDDARNILGPPPYELYDDSLVMTSSVEATMCARAVTVVVKRRSGIGPRYGEEEGIGDPDGKPHYYRPYEPLSEEQQVINARGLAAARAALADHS